MWKRRKAMFLRRLALGLAVAAIAAPAAQAYPDGAVQSGLRVQGIDCVPKWGCRASGPIRPDDRAVRGVQSTDVLPQAAPRFWPGVDPTSGQDYPLYSYRSALQQDNGATPTRSVGAPRVGAPLIGSDTASDVDWRDVGIGAGFALMLLLVAGATVSVRHRHSSVAA